MPAHSASQVQSDSGARLGLVATGDGPPVVFVHGTASDVTSWAPVTDRLGQRHRCVRYDRCGRGDSTDPGSFSLDTEVADLVAVMADAGPACHVVAHSYGGLIALAAASRQPERFSSLAVYEAPAHFPDTQFADPVTVDALRRTLAGDGPDAAIVYFMKHFPKVPQAAIDGMRQSPGWHRRVGAAHTIPRELDVAERFDVGANVRVPTSVPVLLFLGDASPLPFQSSHRQMAALLPQSVTSVLAGQGHRAMDAIPQLMATRLEAFFDGR